MAQPVVGEMEMHSVVNLASLQTLLAYFFPSKTRPNLVSENHRYCHARSCSLSARAHTYPSLSLSLPVRVLCVSGRGVSVVQSGVSESFLFILYAVLLSVVCFFFFPVLTVVLHLATGTGFVLAHETPCN